MRSQSPTQRMKRRHQGGLTAHRYRSPRTGSKMTRSRCQQQDWYQYPPRMRCYCRLQSLLQIQDR